VHAEDALGDGEDGGKLSRAEMRRHACSVLFDQRAEHEHVLGLGASELVQGGLDVGRLVDDVFGAPRGFVHLRRRRGR